MPRPPNLENIPVSVIAAELRRREAIAEALRERRDALVSELSAVERELAALDGAPRRGRPRRGPGRPPKARRGRGKPGKDDRAGYRALPDLLTKILKGRTMSLIDVVAAAKKAGYPAKSKYFTAQVAAALRNRKRFRRVARGRYRAR